MKISALQISIFLLFLVFLLSGAHAYESQLRRPAAATGAVTSASVAVVSGEVVTSREVQIAGIVERALAFKDKPANAVRDSWLVSYGGEAFGRQLSQVLLDRVVLLEAESFAVATIKPEDMASAEKKIRTFTKGWRAWDQLEVADAELAELINQHLRAQAFLKFKSESSGVIVADQEAQAYYERNRVKFGNLPFAQFKQSIKEVIAKEQLEIKLKDWFELLKRKYTVRILNSSAI